MPALLQPRLPKHLPKLLWPDEDRRRLDAAFAPGDLFDEDAPPGGHLAAGTRRHIETGYRRWLGFLSVFHPGDLSLGAEERITPQRVRDFVTLLQKEVRDSTIASILDGVYCAARLIAPALDWVWLASVERNMHARSMPLDRLEQLQAPWDICDLGLSLMDEARDRPADPHFVREVAFRDGLVLALLSLWPIRRRSIAALTIAASRSAAVTPSFSSCSLKTQSQGGLTHSQCRHRLFRILTTTSTWFDHGWSASSNTCALGVGSWFAADWRRHLSSHTFSQRRALRQADGSARHATFGCNLPRD